MDLNKKDFKKAVTALIKECDKNLNLEHRINLFTWELLEELENNSFKKRTINIWADRYGDI